MNETQEAPKMKWRTLSEVKVPDIAGWVEEASKEGQIVHVGTDSLQTGRFTQFVTVVVIHNKPHGGRAAYSREVVPRISSLRERLTREVWRSLTLALQLTGVVPGEINIHIDANVQERYKSSQYAQELVGLVMGQGFAAVLKPDAWAASHAADHVVRTLGRLPNQIRRVPGNGSQLGPNPRAA